MVECLCWCLSANAGAVYVPLNKSTETKLPTTHRQNGSTGILVAAHTTQQAQQAQQMYQPPRYHSQHSHHSQHSQHTAPHPNHIFQHTIMTKHSYINTYKKSLN
jgi:hypothetical protein